MLPSNAKRKLNKFIVNLNSWLLEEQEQTKFWMLQRFNIVYQSAALIHEKNKETLNQTLDLKLNIIMKNNRVRE